jgi:hypothetical protein
VKVCVRIRRLAVQVSMEEAVLEGDVNVQEWHTVGRRACSKLDGRMEAVQVVNEDVQIF